MREWLRYHFKATNTIDSDGIDFQSPFYFISCYFMRSGLLFSGLFFPPFFIFEEKR